ncbi:BamA/TamA family outer membrane protein [Desertivirga arenae]|uniref:BamA/TamA family outer membrane protein n=1 Tax=Desertivirga arenae TaxID=2810309 RepID=UPI001A975CFC|nr:hypothetical protein [Pedobacter sp. SYSU D00823]
MSQTYSLSFKSNDPGFRLLSKIGELSLSDSASVVRKIQEVLAEVRGEGYLMAEVSKVEWNNRKVIAAITPNNIFQITRISRGNIPANYLTQAGYSDKDFQKVNFIPDDLEKLFQKLVMVYSERGYPFAILRLDSVQLGVSTLAGALRVERGNFVVFDSLQIAGDSKVSRRYLESFLDVKQGEAFRQSSMDRMEDRLKNLPFIRSVKSPMLKFSGNKARVTLFLEKQSTNQFDGVLGFLPDDNSGRLKFVGDLKLYLQNPFGRAEQFDFNYKGLPQKSKELNLGLHLSELFSTPFGLALGFDLYKQGVDFQNIHSRASFNYRLPGGSISLLLQNRSGSTIDADTVNNSSSSFGNTGSTTYGLGFLHQSLNSTISPTRGMSFTLSLESGKRRVTGMSTGFDNVNRVSRQYRINSRTDTYYPISVRSIFRFNNETGILIGKNLFDNELYRIGGFSSLRGFNEQSLLASSYSYFNAEYRLLVENTSYLFAFINQGILRRSTVSSATKDYPLGFGAGINLRVKTGLFSLSYALGNQKDNPLNLQSGKIHFGLVTLF